MISYSKGELAAIEEQKAIIDVGGSRVWCVYATSGTGDVTFCRNEVNFTLI